MQHREAERYIQTVFVGNNNYYLLTYLLTDFCTYSMKQSFLRS